MLKHEKFHRQSISDNCYNDGMKQVSFTVDDLRLTGHIFLPEKPGEKQPGILFVHGWTSAQERSFQYAKALAEIGYICMVFDMRGHGVSEGDIKKFAPKDFLEDVVSAYDYFSQVKEIDREQISVVGSSFGSYLAILLSEKRTIKNLVLRVPADYPDEIFEKPKHNFSGGSNDEIVTWRNKKRSPKETIALQALSKYTGNVLIIESEKDTIVPHQTVANYRDAVKNKKKLTHVVMLNAPHSLKEGHLRDECTQILMTWFTKDKKGLK
jgi:esterase/lipase